MTDLKRSTSVPERTIGPEAKRFDPWVQWVSRYASLIIILLTIIGMVVAATVYIVSQIGGVRLETANIASKLQTSIHDSAVGLTEKINQNSIDLTEKINQNAVKIEGLATSVTGIEGDIKEIKDRLDTLPTTIAGSD